MKEFGFKKLDTNNWLLADESIYSFHRVLSNGDTRPVTKDEWFEDIQKIQLDDSVPQKIQELFEVAKGTMIYGYFYYPIFTLAAEQFTRIAETALSEFIIESKLENRPKARSKFRDKVEWLRRSFIINNASYSSWNSIIRLRNRFSHPEQQKILTPGMAIDLMKSIADNINYLFDYISKLRNETDS